MKWLDEKLLDAEGVIWVMPIFEEGVPAIMRIVQDRLFGPSHDTGMNMVAGKIGERAGRGSTDPRKFKKKVTSLIAIGGSDWSTRVSCDLDLCAVKDEKERHWNGDASCPGLFGSRRDRPQESGTDAVTLAAVRRPLGQTFFHGPFPCFGTLRDFNCHIGLRTTVS